MADPLTQYGSKRHYLKVCAQYLALIIGAFVLYFAASYFIREYGIQQGAERVDATAQALKQAQRQDYQDAMADTVGGATPQETLRLYISAVEKGDYELASRYFIRDKQQGELESLRNSPQKNLDNVIRLLTEDLKSEGSYSENRKEFVVSRPLLVDFKLYPNGVWKIIEI